MPTKAGLRAREVIPQEKSSHSASPPSSCPEHQYSAKLVCGVIEDRAARPPLPVGQYFTAVNIHNPLVCKEIEFRWKVVVALPDGTGAATRMKLVKVAGGRAIEIDCAEVMEALAHLGRPAPEFAKGWVVVQSSDELDVVAVYGTAASPGGAVNTFHTERVPGRCVTPCGPFEMDLSTPGKWELRSIPSGGNPPSLVAPADKKLNDRWTKVTHDYPNVGTDYKWKWVGPNADPSKSEDPEGPYVFGVNFDLSDLCDDFEKPTLTINFLVDNSGIVFLNGVRKGDKGTLDPLEFANFQTPLAQPLTITDGFQPGVNSLEIRISNVRDQHNHQGPTGLAVDASFRADRATCP